jgi:hypothetical protein
MSGEDEDPETPPLYSPDLALIDRVISRIGGEDQFKDLPTVRLLDSAVHINEDIVANICKLESALERPALAPSSPAVRAYDRLIDRFTGVAPRPRSRAAAPSEPNACSRIPSGQSYV